MATEEKAWEQRIIEKHPVPHSEEAEAAVLGSVLVGWMHKEENYLAKARRFISSDSFYRDRHGWIYQAMIDVATKHEAVNQITVAYQLSQKKDRLMACGGAAYLAHLVAETPTPLFIEDYTKIVMDTARLRGQIGRGKQMVEDAYQGTSPKRQPPHRDKPGIGF